MSIDLSRQFLKLMVHYRHQNLVAFAEEHGRLYQEAEQSGDYGPCIGHYYSLMSKLIEQYFSGSFHFVPPLPLLDEKSPAAGKSIKAVGSRKRHALLHSLPGSIRLLHLRIGECLQLGPGKRCLDIGCGIGDVIQHLAFTGADFTGLTLAPNEVQQGNANFRSLGIHTHCRLLEADCSKTLPLGKESQDAAYAIYSLKYLPTLSGIFQELNRVLKPDGLLLVYDLLKTDIFDKDNQEHNNLLGGLEFACGMPPLHSRQQMLSEASAAGFELIRAMDLDAEAELPFHHWFSHSRSFMWMMRSPMIGHLIRVAQLLRILPPGFHRFNKVFLSGTVDKIVRAGQLGILSGAEILLFRKRSQ